MFYIEASFVNNSGEAQKIDFALREEFTALVENK
jgi:hypothetical protein